MAEVAENWAGCQPASPPAATAPSIGYTPFGNTAKLPSRPCAGHEVMASPGEPPWMASSPSHASRPEIEASEFANTPPAHAGSGEGVCVALLVGDGRVGVHALGVEFA